MDSTPHWIATGFLLIVSLLLCRHLLRARAPGAPIHPALFLAFSVTSLSVAGALLAYWGPTHALLALSFGLGLAASLARPALALAYFVALSIVRPWESTEHETLLFIPKLMGLTAIASWLIHGLLSRKLRVLWDGPTRVFFALCAWLLLASITSGTMDESLTHYLNTVVIAAVVFFLVSNAPQDRSEAHLIERVTVWSVSAIIAAAAAKTLADPTFSLSTHRLDGFGLTGNSNDLAALASLALPFALLRPGPKIMRFIFAVILLGGVALSQSRGAMLGLALAGATGMILRSRQPAQALRRAIVAIPILAVAAMTLQFARNTEDLAQSSTSRFNYALAGLNMAVKNPVFGVGFNNYPRYYESYNIGDTYEWGQRTAHSSWVLVLAEAGFIGLALFVILFVAVFRRAWAARHEEPVLVGAMVSYGVAMSFLSHTYTFFPYLLFALVLYAARFPMTAAALAFALTGAGSTPAAHATVRTPASVTLEASAGSEKPFGPQEARIRLQPKIELKGSRGETLSFVLRLSASSGCGKLALQGLGATRVRFYAMPQIRIEHASYPGAPTGTHYDPLLPQAHSRVCISTGGKTWLWGEAEIPSSARPGDYNGTLTFTGEGSPKKRATAALPIRLRVWHMLMPETASLPAYSELTSWFTVLGHHGKWAEGEDRLAEKYIAEMQKHRIYPVKSWIAPLEIKNGRLDLTDRPTPTQAFAAVTLKQRPKSVYFDFPALKTAEYYRAIENTLGSIGRPGRAMVYLWDEPQKNEFAPLIALARTVRAQSPSLKILVTTTPKPELESLVDIFVPVAEQLDVKGFPRLSDYKRLQQAGKEVWWYVSCMSHGCEALVDTGAPDLVIDRPSVYVRSIAWVTEKLGLDAFLYYSVNNGFQKYPARDPWKSLWDFSGNGDGTLFYPGRPGERGLQEHGPVPSIRLKLWRESSYDAEYIRWMQALGAAKPAWWDAEYSKLVRSPLDWEKDYSRYQSLRDRAGDFLNQKLRAAP